MKLADIPDIDFVNVDAQEIENAVFDSYQNITGRALAQGDPVRLFLLFQADVIIRLLNKINFTAKQNLLKYAAGDNLDVLAANAWTTRIAASAAHTTLKATLSAVREKETIIPKGTRVSTQDNIAFATDTALIIKAGEQVGVVAATCTQTGTVGNDFRVGEICNIVDPVAYVDTMVNTTLSEGGSDTETDDSLRERVWEAPETLSVAGPTGAYKARTKAANSSIIDVYVDSPSPGVVRVVPLLTGGEAPGEEILAEVQKELSADSVRPLTDYVQTVAPTIVSYDINATYYIDDDADATTVQAAVAAAVSSFTTWQRARLGRDINPSRLVQMLMGVSGVKRVDVVKPAFTVLSNTQVAHEKAVSVVMAGSEDE